ncbi:MAG: hypothetical protein GDA48_25005 [Hormoscilla sp. GM102CHS1]|nr:hypothetical protein [Hormoscilla sp. GM102CHS1]
MTGRSVPWTIGTKKPGFWVLDAIVTGHRWRSVRANVLRSWMEKLPICVGTMGMMKGIDKILDRVACAQRILAQRSMF